MALKTKIAEVKHFLANGVPGEMNTLVADYLNNGWDILEAKLVSYDGQNNTITVFYILAKYNKSE